MRKSCRLCDDYRMARALVVLLALARTAAAEPRLQSPSAIAIDAATGEVLLWRRAVEVRPIASMTKLFAALALRNRVDYSAWTTIATDDLHASRGGAQSPLRE